MITHLHLQNYNLDMKEATGMYLVDSIVSSPDNGESSTDFIGYVGGSLDLTESVGAYGEISLLTDETADNAYTVKVGAKYTF